MRGQTIREALYHRNGEKKVGFVVEWNQSDLDCIYVYILYVICYIITSGIGDDEVMLTVLGCRLTY